MKKIVSIVTLALAIIYGPGMIARSCENKQENAAKVIWETYCRDHGIDPENPTQEQQDEYLDVYCETDEYHQLFNFLTK